MDHIDLPAEGLATIVVATDFSSGAADALNRAIGIAAAHHARLELVHAIEMEAAEPIPPELRRAVEKGLRAAEDTARREGVEAASRHRQGKAWEVVAEAAAETGADLVVVGARGQTAYARPLIGSRADRIIRTAPTPVLTVRAADGGTAWRPKTVLLATDFSQESERAASAALRLVRPFPERPRLVLLHVWQPLIEFEYAWAPVVLKGRLDEARKRTRADLERLAAVLRGADFRVSVVMHDGYPAQGVEREAEANNADLIAVGTHGRSGLKRLMLGSIAERVLHHARCPVLTARLQEAAVPVGVSEEAGVT